MEMVPGWGPGGTCWGAEAPAVEPCWSGRCWSWWWRGEVKPREALGLWHPMHFWTTVRSSNSVYLSSYFLEALQMQICDLWVHVCMCVLSVMPLCIFFLPFCLICVPKCHTVPWGLVLLSISVSAWQYFYFWTLKFARSLVYNVEWQIVPY